MADEKFDNQPNLIQHFVKSNDYKTVFATGIYGGGTINGLLCINFIADIPPLPITTESKPQGNTLVEIKRDFGGKTNIREVQCAVLLDLQTAKLLKDWLTHNLTILENAINQSKQS